MNNTTTKTKFSLLQRAQAWWTVRRDRFQQNVIRNTCPAAVEAAGRIPSRVRAAWMQQAPDEFPGMPVDDGAWLRCSVGLAQFFEACQLQQSAGPCALPSKGADSVWHVWLAVDPGGLSEWQRRHFGRDWPHHEADTLGAPLEDSLARTWAGACRLQRLNPLGPRLPVLFAVDGQLRLPTGWAYRYQRSGLVHRQIDGFGRPTGRAVAHAAIGATSLVALGLMTEAELKMHRRDHDSSGSSCGSSCYSSSDGGGDGGSSCGSSCGGGGD